MTRYIVMVLLILLFVGVADADSIWAKRDTNAKAAYTDDVARKIGDVLTITISESSKVDNKAKRDLQKSVSKSLVFDGNIGNFADIGEFGTEASADNSLNGKADYKDERKFVDSISVVVVDIMPNGNLVVKGTRQRDIGGDIQLIEVSGIVRVSDISYDNIVKSERVTDFYISSKNKGVADPYTRPGWLGRIFDIIWPF
ncbi:MAG: flagellar basal body L-ring protein FlgH [Anaerohalosphaera sp.]|nr:flagellar basal body L-ring protein FlgH [Anaerohalosphaera sp.]